MTYTLGITPVDPIAYQLPFERFQCGTRRLQFAQSQPKARILIASANFAAAQGEFAAMAAQIAAISSSAWKVVMPYSLRRLRWCSSGDAGVIG